MYHVIIMETQILYLDNGTTITRIGNNFNRTYDVSEGRIQLVDMLHPSYNYTIRIAAATAAGIGPFSDFITVMTLEDGEIRMFPIVIDLRQPTHIVLIASRFLFTALINCCFTLSSYCKLLIKF